MPLDDAEPPISHILPWPIFPKALTQGIPESEEVARSAYGYVLKVQTMMRIILPAARDGTAQIERAKQLLAQNHYTWAELFELEVLCVELASDDRLIMIRPADVDLSVDLSNADGTVEWMETPPPAKPPGGGDTGAGTAGTSPPTISRPALSAAVLLGQQRFFRALRRERALDRLRFRLGQFTLALLCISGSYYWLAVGPTDRDLAMTSTFGVLGAFASVLRRIQDVGEKINGNAQSGASVAMLMDGSWSLYLALASGGLFGILGFWLFAGGLGGAFLSEGLIPHFWPPANAKSSGSLPYLLQGVDYGKMAAWAFFFGFAERFIPDLLTQLSKSGNKGNSPGAQPGKDKSQ